MRNEEFPPTRPIQILDFGFPPTLPEGRREKSAFLGGAIFCIVRIVTSKPVGASGRSMLKVAPLREAR